MEITTLPNGDKLYCLNKGEALLLYEDLFANRGYFKFGIAIEAGATVVDVGANIGLFALLASQEARDVRIISLEPLPPIFSVLKANYELHKITGECLPFGLGKKQERTIFTFYPDNTALSGRYAELVEEKQLVVRILENRLPDTPRSVLEEIAARGLSNEPYECEVRSLSDIFRNWQIAQVDLLKIDVEKAELDVLEGIEVADWPRVKQVVMEVHNLAGRLQRVCNLLEAQGFEVHCSQSMPFAATDLYDVFAFRR